MEPLVKLVKDAEGVLRRAADNVAVEGDVRTTGMGSKARTNDPDAYIAEIAKTPSVIIPRAMVDGGYVANRVLGEGTPEQHVYDFEFYDKLRPAK